MVKTASGVMATCLPWKVLVDLFGFSTLIAAIGSQGVGCMSFEGFVVLCHGFAQQGSAYPHLQIVDYLCFRGLPALVQVLRNCVFEEVHGSE